MVLNAECLQTLIVILKYTNMFSFNTQKCATPKILYNSHPEQTVLFEEVDQL